MFFGPDGWLGIDIGPVGAAVLYAALWLFVIHLSTHSERGVPRATHRCAERQAWVALVFVPLIAFHLLNLRQRAVATSARGPIRFRIRPRGHFGVQSRDADRRLDSRRRHRARAECAMPSSSTNAICAFSAQRDRCWQRPHVAADHRPRSRCLATLPEHAAAVVAAADRRRMCSRPADREDAHRKRVSRGRGTVASTPMSRTRGSQSRFATGARRTRR